ncbi:ras-related protein Rab-15 isoform X4 [Leopardus geoffroyi]|uniref:ras-related protein Rab-15 isoform X4 n=1 Tax=Leopardus geoffroyi TaxID=46844 RepID=UPI001E25F316|nr:ras-related protein Rab-15 isoform X4 [Leopardus geoffroyi]
MRERPPTMCTTSYYVHVLHIHCLIRIPQQLLGGQWYCHSTGVDFKMKTIEVDGIKVRIQIWDTAGQERYQTITKQYYRRAQYAPEGVQKILIGNKADEEQKRQVGREQGQQLAKEYGMDFYETSACTNLNIKESFTRLTELVLQAHRKELDGLRTRASNELALAELEEDEGKPEGPANSSKTCWC